MTRPRVYGGLTAEERYNDRRNRFLAAGLELLRTEGLSKVTIAGVCAKAGITDRYFYEIFASRDVLVDVLFEEIASESAEIVFSKAIASRAEQPRERMRAAIEAAIDLLLEGELGPATQSQMDETVMRHRSALTRALAGKVEGYAHLFFGPGSYGTAMVRTAIRYAIGGAVEAASGWLDGTLDVTREELTDISADVLLASGVAGLAAAEKSGKSDSIR